MTQIPKAHADATPSASRLAPAADVASALSHPLRLHLCERLLAGACCVGDAVDGCDADQPTVSRHLAVLRRAGVVVRVADGRRRVYELVDPVVIARLLDDLNHLAASAAATSGG